LLSFPAPGSIYALVLQNRKMKGLKETRKAEKAEKVAAKKAKAEAARQKAVGSVFGGEENDVDDGNPPMSPAVTG
jgi:hypothetical protein